MAKQVRAIDSVGVLRSRRDLPERATVVALCIWIASLSSVAIGDEKPAARPERLTQIAAERLKVEESEVFRRAEELKQLRIESFDKHLRFGDSSIAQLAKRLADHERRAAAAIQGVAADGDVSLDDSKARMVQDARQIRIIHYLFATAGPRLLAYHELAANVVGTLRQPTGEGRAMADGGDGLVVDVDALGIEESIPRLLEWRRRLEDNCRGVEERQQPLMERIAAPQSAFKAKGDTESKAMAQFLVDHVLRDIENLSARGFDEAMKEYAGRTHSAIRDSRLKHERQADEWGSDPGMPPGDGGVIGALRAAFADAKQIESEAERDAACEEIKRQIRKRANELVAFDRKIKSAEAIELEAQIVLLLRESRDDIVEKLDPNASEAPSLGPEEKLPAGTARRTLTELAAETIPRIQEINQVVRHCREVWLR